MKKVYAITGPRGSGKSTSVVTFPAATAAEMAKLLVVDTEDSMSDIYEQMCELGMPFTYVRAYERFPQDADLLSAIASGKLPWVSREQKSSLVEFYLWFVDMLDRTLADKQYKYLGIDTIEPVEASMAAWAEQNKQLSGWSGTRAYGRLETEAVRPLYENLFEGIGRRGVENIIVTSHLKRVWEDDKPILNKVQMGGRIAVLSRLSSLMVWLSPTRENPDGAPAGIVLKARRGMYTAEDGEWLSRRVLPERIPHFSWRDVRAYNSKPADLSKPALGERLTDDERAMISEFLTDEQMRLMVIGAEVELETMKTVPMALPGFLPEADISTEVKRMIAAGAENGEIATAVPGATLPMIIVARRQMKQEE